MATDDNELSNFEDINISSIIALQAHVRGFLVRKWFGQLRDVYVAAVTEIERFDNITVVWRGALPRPQIMKTSQRKQMAHDRPDPGNKDSKNTPSRCSTPHGVSPRSCSNINHHALLNHTQLKSVKSANTQTSSTDYTVEQHGRMEAGDKDGVYGAVETQTMMIDTTPLHQNIELKPEYSMPYTNKDNDCVDCAENLKIHEVNIPDNRTTVLQINDLHLNLDSERTETESDTEHRQTQTKSDTAENKLSKDEGENLNSDSQRSTRLQSKVRETSQLTTATMLDREQNEDTSCRPQDFPRDVPSGYQGSPLPRGRQEISTLTNVTSVWDSINSVRDSYPAVDVDENLPSDPDELQSLRKNIALELLWLQQAINSRKNYLRLKQQM